MRGTGWLSGRPSDSGARGRGFESYMYLRHVVSLKQTLYSPKVLIIPRKRWLRSDMTENVLTGTLNLKKKFNELHLGKLAILTFFSVPVFSIVSRL